METKVCIKCEKEKPIDNFQLRTETGKYRNVCRECVNTQHRDGYRIKMGGLTKREKRQKARDADPKRCVRCGILKPLSEFNIHNRERGYYRNLCKECQNEWAREYNKTEQAQLTREEWNKKNQDKIEAYRDFYKNDPVQKAKRKKYHRKKRLMENFGITVEEYDNMLASQGGKCAICGTDKPYSNGRIKNFLVDHCHETGQIRGLLCHNCNVGLGNFKDDSRILFKALTYLELFNKTT